MTDVTYEQLPEAVKETVEKLKERTGLSNEEVMTEFNKRYNTPFVQQDPSFETDEERMGYVRGMVWNDLIKVRPVEPFDIIPIGYGSPGYTKSNNLQTEMFVITGSGEFKRLMMQDKLAYEAKNLTMLSKYNGVQLSSFPDGTLITDKFKTQFNHPEATPLNSTNLFETLKKMGVAERITIKEAPAKMSKVDTTGYTVRTDWKVIRGFLISAYGGDREDGTPYGGCRINDPSVMTEGDGEPLVAPDGSVIPQNMSVWCAKEMVEDYQGGGEGVFDFYGTVQKNKKGETFMNAYVIIPIHARPASEGDANA